MKTTIALLLIACTFLISCSSGKNIQHFENKKKFSENRSILGLNSINADNNHYTKAVLDYLLINKVLENNSLQYFGTPSDIEIGSLSDTVRIAKMVLFPTLKVLSPLDSIRRKNLDSSGIKECVFDIPSELKDLKSGFQFNHYVFKSTNKAAMQAFGIVNSEIEESSLYIVTDYLQYQDIHCSGLPKIRYAIGVRAELRILGIKTESELSGIGSLAGLAAQVETDKLQVSITIKTIGITGIEPRLSIPSNSTFDVKTYSDYEKILDFIRNLKDEEKLSDKLIVQPQIIPVMDEYRTTLDYSFYPMLESIEILEIKLQEMKNRRIDKAEIIKIEEKINLLKLSMIEKEVDKLAAERVDLVHTDGEINNYSTILGLMNFLKDIKPSSRELENLYK